MRISDWSSDVCSSDLTAPPVEPAEEIVDIGAVVTQIERDLAALLADQRVELSISRVGGPFMGRAGDANVDRKSVVEGKSVSVGVGLGGRRIIKKKKQNSQKHTR